MADEERPPSTAEKLAPYLIPAAVAINQLLTTAADSALFGAETEEGGRDA